jgi:hypothetical protein
MAAITVALQCCSALPAVAACDPASVAVVFWVVMLVVHVEYRNSMSLALHAAVCTKHGFTAAALLFLQARAMT